MNKSCTAQSQWMSLYQKTIDTSTSVDVISGGGSSTISGAGDNYFSPKSCISKAKPSPRRSRASKKSPTTLLNADAKNFRSLVQQYTGCRRRRSSSTSISFTNPSARGPININFAHNHNNTTADDRVSISQQLLVAPMQQHYQLQQLQQQQEEKEQVPNEVDEEEEDSLFGLGFDTFTADDDDFLPTKSSCFPRPAAGSENIPHGFLMDDLYFIA